MAEAMRQTADERWAAALEDAESRGEKSGLKRGEKRGEAQGEVRAHRRTLRQVIEERFGAIPTEMSERIEAVDDVDILTAWTRDALRAASIEDLDFAQLEG